MCPSPAGGWTPFGGPSDRHRGYLTWPNPKTGVNIRHVFVIFIAVRKQDRIVTFIPRTIKLSWSIIQGSHSHECGFQPHTRGPLGPIDRPYSPTECVTKIMLKEKKKSCFISIMLVLQGCQISLFSEAKIFADWSNDQQISMIFLLQSAKISKYPWKNEKNLFLAIKYPWKYIGLLMAKKYIPLSVLKPIFYNRFKQDITWSWFFSSKYIKTDLKWFFFFFNLIKKGQKLLFCNSVFHQTLDPSEF